MYVCVCVRCFDSGVIHPFITVASQGLCDLSNLEAITSSGTIPVVSLDEPLCFGCGFLINFELIAIPLGTEWFVVFSNGTSIPLTNQTTGVTLSETNGTILLSPPSSVGLEFMMGQLRCTYLDEASGMLHFLINTFTKAGKSCLTSEVICIIV